MDRLFCLCDVFSTDMYKFSFIEGIPAALAFTISRMMKICLDLKKKRRGGREKSRYISFLGWECLGISF